MKKRSVAVTERRLSKRKALDAHKKAQEKKTLKKQKKEKKKQDQADSSGIGGITSHFSAAARQEDLASEEADSAEEDELSAEDLSPETRRGTGGKATVGASNSKTKAKRKLTKLLDVSNFGEPERVQLLAMLDSDVNFAPMLVQMATQRQLNDDSAQDNALRPIPNPVRVAMPVDPAAQIIMKAIHDNDFINDSQSTRARDYSFSATNKKWQSVLDHLSAWTKQIKAIVKAHRATRDKESTNYDLSKKIYFILPAELYPRTVNAFAAFVKWFKHGVSS